MPAPRWLARINLHFTNHLLGPLARRLPGMAVVIHTGRKSHRRYRTPVVVFHNDDRFIIALTYGRDSEWVQNVLAQGDCELETQGRILHLDSARVVHDPDRRAATPFARIILKAINVSDFLELRKW